MATDPLTRQYGSLTGAERFALMLEAMARKDEPDADRLEDTCPWHNYRIEDPEFPARMKRAFMITAFAMTNVRRGLAMVEAAKIFRDSYREFAGGPTLVATTAFLYGRSYGHWECGAIEQIELPDKAALKAEMKERPDLKAQLRDVRAIAGEGVKKVAEAMMEAMGQGLAGEILSQWEGFGRFCRQSLGLEPMTVVKAYGLGKEDPEQEVLAEFPDAKPDEAKTAHWADNWKQNWDRRFAKRERRTN